MDPRPSNSMTDHVVNRRKNTAQILAVRLCFAFAVFVLSLFALEIVCRIADLGESRDVAHYVSDWHAAPGGRTFWVVRGPGFNADGMRDRAHDVENKDGAHRIVCLGDSVTFGQGVAQHETYPFLLEALLKQRGLNAEVFNIAVSGWSTRQQVTAYREIARRYRPDQVFLGFCLNDVAEMHNNLAAPPAAPVRWLARHSALTRWLIDAEGRQIHSVEELLRNPDAPAVRAGWTLVFAELEALARDTRADGTGLSVLIFPFRLQLANDAPAPIAQQGLFAWCRKRGIPCLDLLPALRRTGPRAFVDESHLSEAGARAVAEELVRWGTTGCIMCGRDMSDVPSEACPDCGHPADPR